jgi:UPF0755 protein
MVKTRKKRKGNSAWINSLIAILLVVTVITTIVVFRAYQKVYTPNVTVEGKDPYLYIPTGAGFDEVVATLHEKQFILNKDSFTWLAEKMNYQKNVKPGRYLLTEKMSNRDLIRLLRSGKQTPVQVTFNNIRDKEKLAGIVSRQLEADSADIVKYLSDELFLSTLGANRYTALVLFIPNTYEFFWNTNARQFIERMKKEHDRFWSKERQAKAELLGLDRAQVSTLASIVQEESVKRDERSRIAGVYLNRLRVGMRLQADPTVKFAVGDPTIKRVLKKHLEANSPYNTYLNAGLPPGPICLPEIQSIDAVLNTEKHDYYYFCAKDDFSGYHNFARTLEQHNRNAQLYRQALNRNRIMR